YDEPSSPQTPDNTHPSHYIEVVINLTGDLEAVATGDTFTVVLNGQIIKYVVPALDKGPDVGERNLNTVATGLAAKITSDSARYDAVAVGTQIRIHDQDLTAPNGIDPIVFSAERGGSVHAVFDIDNTRLVTGSFQVFTGYQRVLAYYQTVIVGYYDPF